jgi:hypothetical protein
MKNYVTPPSPPGLVITFRGEEVKPLLEAFNVCMQQGVCAHMNDASRHSFKELWDTFVNAYGGVKERS